MIRKIGIVIVPMVGAILLVATVLLLWPVRATPLPDAAHSRVIVGARIVDVVAGTIDLPTRVEIRDGVMAAIGPGAGQASMPSVDGRGAFLVPGFWDMHVHTFQASPQMHFPLWIAGGSPACAT